MFPSLRFPSLPFPSLFRAGAVRRPAQASTRAVAASVSEEGDAARESGDRSWLRDPRRVSSTRRRSRAAAGRLEVALCGFERSIVALRTAALDHVDSQDPARLTLRLFLDRRSERGRTA